MTCDLASGDLSARVLPQRGMLVASLRHRGEELLRRVDDLDRAAARGSTAGIPLLHPWANRLASTTFDVAGRSVSLDAESPLVHLDGNGLPIHGVPWSRLEWRVERSDASSVSASFVWTADNLLAVFPFPHRLQMSITLDPDGLTIETVMSDTIGSAASLAGPVPVSFGFHPYLGLPSPRREWRLTLPAMTRLELDPRGIPTGRRVPFDGFDGPLGDRAFDDGFALQDEHAALVLSDADRRVSIEFLGGFRFCQVFAPTNDNCVALEPMTAPANALVSGDGLRILRGAGTIRTAFRVRVGSTSPSRP